MQLSPRWNVAAVTVVVACWASQFAAAGDWPQILGPQRNGVAAGEKLNTNWKASEGPKELWQKPVGSGLAGVAVVKGVTYVFHRLKNQELLEAVDARTGKSRWKASWPTDYDDTIAGDNGPRCVPVVSGDHVYAFGAAGTLACIQTQDGKIVWSKNVGADYNAPRGYFGVGSTPIVDSGVLIVNVGGPADKAGIVGFDPKTGDELWKTVADTASYSAPVATTVNGVRHVICITRLKCVSLDPKNGKVRFEFPFGKRGPTVNGASPLVMNDNFLVTASYGIGATLAKIGTSSVDLIWSDDEILSSQYSTPVFVDGYVYAVEGRQDAGPASLRCFDPLTKKIAWEKEGFGLATPILAGNQLLLMRTDGELVVVAANPKAYQELAKATLFDNTTRALPALSNGLLYVRDTKTLKCFDLSAN
ncbi:MAG: outer rane biosis protein BamB [Planctomycetaceae bacterium]|nr:outer rane biosis protein BamB [Planctomycetaceae bacterium]